MRVEPSCKEHVVFKRRGLLAFLLDVWLVTIVDTYAMLRGHLILLNPLLLKIVFLTHLETAAIGVPKVVPGKDSKVMLLVQL